MSTERLRFLFEKYVTNTISEKERAEFFQLVSNSETNEDLKKMLDELWTSLPDDNVHVSIADHVYSNVVQATQLNSHRKAKIFSWMKVAAALTILSLASATLLIYRSHPLVTPTSIAENAVSNKRESFIRLPDGSTVVLNNGSTLKYPNSFEGTESREVYLEGEGFFDIRHDPAHPFIVHSGNVITTVLGTSFNIKAFTNDNQIVVTVTRGKVQVSNEKKVLGILTRDLQITIDKTTVTTDLHATNSEQALAWMERDIFFDDVTMEEATAELENRFNVKIKLLNDTIKRCRFTATFVKGEDLEQILLVICEFNNVSFERTDNAIQIDGAGCN